MKKHSFHSQWLCVGLFWTSLIACNRDKPAEPTPVTSPATATAKAPEIIPASRVRYVERMTGGANTTDQVPMIVAIHGLGDRPESFGGIFDGFSGRARLILPYGLSSYGDGFSWFPISRLEPKALAEGTKLAADELATLLKDLMKSRAVKGKPIVTGFSQGGMLSFTLAVLHPDEIGEALPIAGLLAPPLYPTSWPMGRVAPRVSAFHGDADDRVPIDGARETVQQLTKSGFTATLQEYPNVRHSVSAQMRRDWMAELEAAIGRAASH
jgi:phospholipase/carboxylesterase